ncbi:MAG: hypothetical protein ACE5GI_06275 [Candidatus Aminicenantales bacterium]
MDTSSGITRGYHSYKTVKKWVNLHEQGKSLWEISEKFKTHPETVRRNLQKYGRDTSRGFFVDKIAQKRKYKEFEEILVRLFKTANAEILQVSEMASGGEADLLISMSGETIPVEFKAEVIWEHNWKRGLYDQLPRYMISNKAKYGILVSSAKTPVWLKTIPLYSKWELKSKRNKMKVWINKRKRKLKITTTKRVEINLLPFRTTNLEDVPKNTILYAFNLT